MNNETTTEGPPDWEQRYQDGHTPWHTDRPSEELVKILAENEIPRGRTLELGCGDGVNAVYLSQQGFEVTAFDVSATAIEQARRLAHDRGAVIDFRVGDVLQLNDVAAPFPFVFDRGVYHVLRRTNLDGFLQTLEQATTPGSIYLTMAGNAYEETPEGQDGPPRVTAEEICREFDPLLQLIQLRQFRFGSGEAADERPRPLAWSALFRRP